jgi:hypothetical protein
MGCLKISLEIIRPSLKVDLEDLGEESVDEEGS